MLPNGISMEEFRVACRVSFLPSYVSNACQWTCGPCAPWVFWKNFKSRRLIAQRLLFTSPAKCKTLALVVMKLFAKSDKTAIASKYSDLQQHTSNYRKDMWRSAFLYFRATVICCLMSTPLKLTKWWGLPGSGGASVFLWSAWGRSCRKQRV